MNNEVLRVCVFVESGYRFGPSFRCDGFPRLDHRFRFGRRVDADAVRRRDQSFAVR